MIVGCAKSETSGACRGWRSWTELMLAASRQNLFLFYFIYSCVGSSLPGSCFSLVAVLGLPPLQSLGSRPLGFQRLRLVGLRRQA